MTFIFIILFFLGIIFILTSKFSSENIPIDIKPKYFYRRKNFLLSKSENEFYKILNKAVGDEYFIFPQVHLSTLFDHTSVRQNWQAALAHIQRKSVDFVLCDKEFISPKLAIELDDKTHERPDRQYRDYKVEVIFKNAGLPLLRIKNDRNFNPEEIANKIREINKT